MVWGRNVLDSLVECPLSEQEVVGSNQAAAPNQRCTKWYFELLANACIKSACARLSRRLSKAGKYLFKILLCSRIASMLMLSVTL